MTKKNISQIATGTTRAFDCLDSLRVQLDKPIYKEHPYVIGSGDDILFAGTLEEVAEEIYSFPGCYIDVRKQDSWIASNEKSGDKKQ